MGIGDAGLAAASRRRDRARRRALDRRSAGQAVLPLLPPFRAAHAVRARRAVPLQVRQSVRRRDRHGGCHRGALLRGARPPRPVRQVADHPVRRPRRGTGRSRRSGARGAALPRGAARSAHRQTSRPAARGTASSRARTTGRHPPHRHRRGWRENAGRPPRHVSHHSRARQRPAPRLQRNDVPAHPSRMERAALADRRPRPLHREPVSRTVRRRRRSARDAKPPRAATARGARPGRCAGPAPAQSGAAADRRSGGAGAPRRAGLSLRSRDHQRRSAEEPARPHRGARARPAGLAAQSAAPLQRVGRAVPADSAR